VGSTPTPAGLLSALLALVLLKLAVLRMLATPSTAASSVKEGTCMSKRVKLWFAATLETTHGLGGKRLGRLPANQNQRAQQFAGSDRPPARACGCQRQ
jgi:hypothetical protein